MHMTQNQCINTWNSNNGIVSISLLCMNIGNTKIVLASNWKSPMDKRPSFMRQKTSIRKTRDQVQIFRNNAVTRIFFLAKAKITTSRDTSLGSQHQYILLLDHHLSSAHQHASTHQETTTLDTQKGFFTIKRWIRVD